MGSDTDSAGRMFIGVALPDEARATVDAALRRAMPDGLPGRAWRTGT